MYSASASWGKSSVMRQRVNVLVVEGGRFRIQQSPRHMGELRTGKRFHSTEARSGITHSTDGNYATQQTMCSALCWRRSPERLRIAMTWRSAGSSRDSPGHFRVPEGTQCSRIQTAA